MDGVVLRGEPLETLTTAPPPSASPPPMAAWTSASVGQVFSSTVAR